MYDLLHHRVAPLAVEVVAEVQHWRPPELVVH